MDKFGAHLDISHTENGSIKGDPNPLLALWMGHDTVLLDREHRRDLESEKNSMISFLDLLIGF